MDSKKANNDIITTTRKTITVATDDHCISCVWLDHQPEGNKMFCVLPGECFWLKGWRDSEDND